MGLMHVVALWLVVWPVGGGGWGQAAGRADVDGGDLGGIFGD